MQRPWNKAVAALATTGIMLAALVALAPAASAAVPTAVAVPARASSPALTPPLGWNSWNTYGCDINEAKIRSAADAMVSSGMKAAGYQYVVVDDCWQASTRAADGSLQADPTRFPSGMKALGDYIHSLGLKFGIYQAPRTKTCGQYFGSTPGATGAQGHEVQDANTFAAWGADYLKYDWCSNEGTLQDEIDAFTLMRDALQATGRPIVYSINPNSIRPNYGATYNWSAIADLWRTTEDITASWSSGCTDDCFMGVTEILDVQAGLTAWNGPGHWNDPDMLEVGNHNILSPTENRAHFGMWALMASPLIAGNDITTMTTDTRSILTNADVLAVDQDPNGIQATRVRDDGNVEVWSKPLSDGSVAVGLLNRGNGRATISTTAAEVRLGSGSNYVAKDLYTGAVTNSSGALTASVPGHGLTLLRVKVAQPQTTTTFALKAVQSGKCVDGQGGALDNGTRAIINDCSTALSQRIVDSNGQITVGGKCLDVDNSGTGAGTAVIFWECNGQTNQKWTIGTDGTVKSVLADKCLDVDHGGTTAGTPLLIWYCEGTQNQQWTKVADATPATTTPPVTASAVSRCVAGKVSLLVTVSNTGPSAVDVQITTSAGSRTVTAVPAGKATTQTFATRSTAVTAGTATVVATGTVNGERAKTTKTPSYPAISCG